MKKIVCYLRVSTARQGSSGLGHALPWEDWEHTLEQAEREADIAMREMLGLELDRSYFK